MIDNLKKILNEEQDPKAIEKITSKLKDLLMKNEEVGYIGVQKKPVTVFPDSIVLTNKRIIICKPKNLGLSMDFTDYNWDDIEATFVKENILGSEFSFSTKTDLSISIDYIPKTQARKIFTFAKEQLDFLKNPVVSNPIVEVPKVIEEISVVEIPATETFEEMETEEVTSFAEIIPVSQTNFLTEDQQLNNQETLVSADKLLSELSSEELFEKLQNYKKLLDNGLILQGEYDVFKKDILGYM